MREPGAALPAPRSRGPPCTFADAPEPRAVACVRHLQDAPVVAGHSGRQPREAEQRAQAGPCGARGARCGARGAGGAAGVGEWGAMGSAARGSPAGQGAPGIW